MKRPSRGRLAPPLGGLPNKAPPLEKPSIAASVEMSPPPPRPALPWGSVADRHEQRTSRRLESDLGGFGANARALEPLLCRAASASGGWGECRNRGRCYEPSGQLPIGLERCAPGVVADVSGLAHTLEVPAAVYACRSLWCLPSRIACWRSEAVLSCSPHGSHARKHPPSSCSGYSIP